MKNFRFSLNKISQPSSGRAIFPYLIPTAVIILILSFLLKTAGQAFLIVSAVLFIAAGAAFLSLNKNRGGFLMCLVLFLYCIRTVSLMSGDITAARLKDGADDYINATVITSPAGLDESQYGYCTVKVNSSVQGHSSKGERLLLYADGILNFEIGDILEADVTYSAFDDDSAVSSYSDGIYLRASCRNAVIPLGRSRGLYGLAGKVRSYIKTRIMSYSDNYHVLLAMITGERGYISDELYGRIKDAGVSHVLVVSGMHLVLLCGGLERLLRLLCSKGILRDLLLLAFVLLMSVICGFGISILRAAIVYLLRVLYRRIGRRTNGIHSLSLAVVAVLLIHPYAFHSISFQLSYSATFGILVLSRWFDKKLRQFAVKGIVLRHIAGAVSVSLSAYIATLPVCIAAFGVLSLVAVPVNILLDVPANIMLALCVIGLAFGFAPFIERFFMILADALGDYFLKVVNFASKLPFATVGIRNEQVLTLLVLLCFFLLYVIKTKPYRFLKKR